MAARSYNDTRLIFGGFGWSGLARVSEPLTHTRISLSLANLVKLRLTALRGTNFRARVSLWVAKIKKTKQKNRAERQKPPLRGIRRDFF